MKTVQSIVDPAPRVSLAVEPEAEDRAREFLRALIADARAWDAARKAREAA